MDTQNSFPSTSSVLSSSPQGEHNSTGKTIATEAALTRLLYAQAPMGFLATLLNVVILTMVLQPTLPPAKLLTWCVTMFIITGARFLLVRRHQNLMPTVDQEARWRTRYILGTATIGSAWGSLCLLAFPTHLAYQVFVAFVFAGTSAGAVTILSSVPSAALSFFLLALTPLTWQFFRQGDDLGVAMGTMIVIFLGTLLFAVRHLHATTVESLHLQFTRLGLLDRLTTQTMDLENTNAALQEEIAKHQQTEQALRASEVLYRSLFEHSLDAILLTSPDGRIFSVNPAASHMFGRTVEEMCRAGRDACVDNTDPRLDIFLRQRANSGSYRGELNHKRKDGSVFPCEFSSVIFTDKTGSKRAVNIIRDITERKQAEETLRKAHEELEQRVQERTAELQVANQQLTAEVTERQRAEEALRHSEKYFRTLIEGGSDLIAILRVDGTIDYASPSHKRLLGYESEELQKKKVFLFIHPEDVACVMTAFAAGVQGAETPDSIEFRFRHKDGSWRTLESAGQNLLASPIINGILINSRDITDRRAVEDILKKNEERFRALVENSTDVVMILNTDGTIRYRSPTASGKGIHDYAVDTLIGRNVLEFVHPDDQQRLRDVFYTKVLVRPGVTQLPPFRALHSDGSWRIMEGTHNNLLHHPVIAGIIYTGRDITERKQAEEENRSLQAQLAQAQKLQSIGTLAGGIAHDFNNLLTPIIGFSELLKRTVAPETRAWNNLQEILKASHRAKELVQQMLAFSRPSQHTPIPVALNTVLEDCLALLRAEPSTIEIHPSFDPAAGMVLADPIQLHRVIMNLGVNALQSMEGQRGVVVISVEREMVTEAFATLHPPLTPGPYGKLTVRDTGCGIPTEVQAHIFDPFFTTKEVGKGSGLGLSVVHGIVTSYGGAITVQSELGKGSTFSIYLPLRQETPTETVESPSSPDRARDISQAAPLC